MTTADRLRAAGYVPLPRLWVTQDDLDVIMWMARKHEAQVNAIRNATTPDARGQETKPAA